MFCKDCGTELVNGACPKCAHEAEEQATSTQTHIEAEVKPKKKVFALAIVSMAAGIASIIWGMGIVGAIAAFVTGAIYKKQNGESHTMVKVGTACGIVGLILQFVFFVLAEIIAFVLLFMSGVILVNM